MGVRAEECSVLCIELLTGYFFPIRGELPAHIPLPITARPDDVTTGEVPACVDVRQLFAPVHEVESGAAADEGSHGLI